MTNVSPAPATPLDEALAKAVRWVVPCVVVPLAFGIVGFVGWFVSYWRFWTSAEIWFVMLGLGSIVLGGLGLLVGGAILIRQIYLARQLAADDQRRRVLMHAGFLTTLLIFNVFIAFFLGTVAAGTFASVGLKIDNQSPKRLRDVTITFLDRATGKALEDQPPYQFGAAYPMKSTHFRFRPSSENFRVSAIWDDKDVALFEFDDSISTSTGPRFRVEFQTPDNVKVFHGRGLSGQPPQEIARERSNP